MGAGETTTPEFPGWFEAENPGFSAGMKQLFSGLRQLLGVGTPAVVNEGRPGYTVSADDAGIETYGQLKGRFASAADEYGRDATKATAAVATSASETTRARGDFSSAVSSLNSRLAGMQGPAQGPVVSATTATLGQLVETVNTVVQRPVSIPQMVQAGWPHGGFLRDPSGRRTAPPTDPYEFKQWWTSLTKAEKDEYYARDPFIGNRAGMPFEDRDYYNRLHLQELMRTTDERIRRAEEEVRQLTPRGPGIVSDKNTRNRISDAEKLIRELTPKLNEYRQVEQAIDQPGPRRFLGVLDDKGRAAVSINNPDRAKYHATFVPGTSVDLTKIVEYDAKSLSMYQQSIEQLGSGASPGDVSITTWLGYDRPMNPITDSPSSSYARNGAPALVDFQEGVRVSHEGERSLNTVIGHSYGTSLIGAAASGDHTLDADRVIAVASPGMMVNSASELNLNEGGRVFATTAEKDIIRWSPQWAPNWALGKDPVGADYGAQVFASDPGKSFLGFPSIDAHGSYWNPGNRALTGMGRIIIGEDP